MAAQKALGFSFQEIHRLDWTSPEKVYLTIKVGPAFRSRLDKMTSRSPFRYELLHCLFAVVLCRKSLANVKLGLNEG